jgi:hypothetical protein
VIPVEGMKRYARRWFVGALLGVMTLDVAARQADATVLFARSIDEMARDADVVVVATPTGPRASRWQGGRIVTDVSVRIDAVITGRMVPSSVLTVRLPGGVVGEIGQSLAGAPTLTPDVPTVLFLTASREGVRSVLSLSAGSLPVSVAPGGAVVVLPARTEGMTLLPPQGPTSPARVVLPPEGLPLETFAVRVREVIR